MEQDIKEVKRELTKLRKEIRHHNDRYYNEDNPEISDYEYDQLMLRLKTLEKQYPELITKNSPTQMVGGRAMRTAGVLERGNLCVRRGAAAGAQGSGIRRRRKD